MGAGKPIVMGGALAAASLIAFIVSCSGPATTPDTNRDPVTMTTGRTADSDPSTGPNSPIATNASEPPATSSATTASIETGVQTGAPGVPVSESGPAWPEVDWSNLVADQLGCSNSAELLSPPRFEDLNGDHRLEAVLHARCSPVTSAPNERVFVFDGGAAESTGAAPAASIGDTDRLVDSSLDLTGNAITITGLSRSPSAPNCCADLQVTQVWRWNGSTYARTDYTATATDLSGSEMRPSFITPSGNIECTINSNKNPGNVLCQILQHNFPIGGCEYQPGTIATVGTTGGAHVSGCAGDSMIQLSHIPIDYGTTVHFPAADCLVAENGVTCTNHDGHGFALSRAAFQPF